MHYIGKSKIGKQYSKPAIVYPIIRLPVHCSKAIGTSVQIYKSEHAGRTVFLIIPDNEDSERLRQEVAQPTSEVAQLETETNVESRISVLEFKINKLLGGNFQNNELLDDKTLKEVENKAPESGFEPESEPRQGSMIGHYTTRAA
jgi:hypothetical protein